MGGKGVLGGTIGGVLASGLLLFSASAQQTGSPSPPATAQPPGAAPQATPPADSAQPSTTGAQRQTLPAPGGSAGVAGKAGDKPVLVTADELQYEQDLGLVVA